MFPAEENVAWARMLPDRFSSAGTIIAMDFYIELMLVVSEGIGKRLHSQIGRASFPSAAHQYHFFNALHFYSPSFGC